MRTGSVDTNVLVRLVTQDDEQQAQAVDQLMTRHASRGDFLFVPITVTLELEWVLRSRCKQTKSQVIAVLSALLTVVELSFDAEDALEQALVDYENGTADFGEYLHLALSRCRNALPFWTFDKKASEAPGAAILLSS
ncbi:MAG: type II toxin-antitoxin system VapC family toxin [Rhodoferax sp.]|nr:type II toxin-antitoxin system VapC family toxin [Rhodoferax sp.]